jgi:hypothetical protein
LLWAEKFLAKKRERARIVLGGINIRQEALSIAKKTTRVSAEFAEQKLANLTLFCADPSLANVASC